MSAITEAAREEAARAEAEEPAEPDQPSPGDDEADEAEEAEEPTPAAPEPLSEKQVEAAFKKAGKAAEVYAAKVQDALGPLFERFVPSPLDDLPGFVQVDPQGQVSPEAKAATLAFLGQAPPVEYQENPETRTCRRCAGQGDLLSGSKRPGNELLRCGECNGYGYLPPPTVVGQIGSALASVPPNGAQAAAPQMPHGPEDPRVAELRAAGYMVLDPPPHQP